MDHTRLHALDAIRGFALLLGLLLHGSMSFWPGMEAFGFPISDNSKSMTLTHMLFVLHMFRMAVFYLIAGFFAHLSLHRKGPREFLKDRLKRIALPMAVAWFVSLLLIVPSILWAADKLYGREEAFASFQIMQDSTPDMPVLMHLWFLYYLLWFYFIAVGCSKLMEKADPADKIGGKITNLIYLLCRTRLLWLLAAAVSGLVFYLREDWIAWGGIPSPTEAVWREAPAFVIYGMAFSFGWFFDRQREAFVFLKQHWLQYAMLALLATAFCITRLSPELFTVIEEGRDKLIFAMAYAVASWCWIFAIIGAGMKFFDRENATRRYIADASYWIYLAHLPVIFFLQAALMNVPLHWTIKFPVIILVTTAVTFWTYDRWVRYTFIGTALNGPRRRTEVDRGVLTPG